jgi:hypothetical protein
LTLGSASWVHFAVDVPFFVTVLAARLEVLPVLGCEFRAGALRALWVLWRLLGSCMGIV